MADRVLYVVAPGHRTVREALSAFAVVSIGWTLSLGGASIPLQVGGPKPG